MDYYQSLRRIQEELQYAYLIKNTSKDSKEVEEAIKKIALIEAEIVKLAERLKSGE